MPATCVTAPMMLDTTLGQCLDQEFVDVLKASSDQLLRTVADALPGGSVSVFDRQYRYIFAAGSGLFQAGLKPDQLIGLTLRDVFGAEAHRVESYCEQAFAGKRVSLDLAVFGRVYALTVAPVSDLADAIVVLAQDVTVARGELRRHEVAEQALEQANRQKDVFLATVLHELRQPLGPLRFGLELLKREPVTSTQQRSVAAMERQVQQLERLLMDLTELAAKGQGELELRLERVDVFEVLRDVLQEGEALMRAQKHQLLCHLPPSVHVLADAGRLRQVFSNLLLNAAKYTDAGGRIVVSATADDSEVAISIADNGRGIDPATLPHIFELFVQEDARGAGMGVGLHIVRQIVGKHGGRVEARSQGKGLGSEFIVRLPTRTLENPKLDSGSQVSGLASEL
jgi:signal transduction histidine kinase